MIGAGAPLEDDDLLAHLVADGALLRQAWERGDPNSIVPGLDWDVRTVVRHTGAVHRWAADIVARERPTNATNGSAAFAPEGLADSQLSSWFDDGLAALVATLRHSPADLDCFTFVDGVGPRTFWIRRQAHETAIHRADVEAAAGRPVTPFDAAFAQDGLAELVGSFATESRFAVERPGRLLLDAADGPSWSVTFGAARNESRAGRFAGAGHDAVVRGTSDELYRWAWNRPVHVDVAGDPDVIALWRRVRVT